MQGREAGIRKRVWLYLIRHTALTHVEKEYGSSISDIWELEEMFSYKE
ncbi:MULTISPECIES: hypothetical protein [Candidatus Nitrosocaldus]|uniref:Uncharacterized protein n=1 Tax=Candidatus Nitrosocaldus cavascurensis TaxID=2058097 RepID=A0A2K5AR65_9ARCH|nr:MULTISPECIES: hypothetical protein [Candidatus Nitrosocaldus]SPC34089.1 protein of unknown function [Candidatus Nitrosocaldus cavascurensis]